MRKSSLDAYTGISTSGQREKHYKVILTTLTKLDTATCRDIAGKCELTYHQVQRRMSELERLEKVKVIGRKINEKYKPNIWQIVE